MADQKRTLSIVARLQDFASRQLAALGTNFANAAKGIARDSATAWRSLGGLVDRLATVRNAVIGFAGFRALQGIGRVFEELGDLDDTRAKVQGTAESVTALAYALRLSGTSLDEVRPTLEAFARTVEAARIGSEQKAAALEKLGVSLDSVAGSEIDYVRLLATVAERFGALGSATERAAALNEVFGKSASALIPLLKDGAAGVRALTDEAQRRGLTFTQEELDRAKQFGDAMDRLAAGWERFAQSTLLQLEPVLTRLLELASALVDKLNRGSGIGRTLAQNQGLDPREEEIAAIERMLQSGQSPQVTSRGIQLVDLTAAEIERFRQRLAELRGEAVATGADIGAAAAAAMNQAWFSPEALQQMQATLGRAYDAAAQAVPAPGPVAARIAPRPGDQFAFREALNKQADPSIAAELEKATIAAEQQKLAFQEAFDAGRISAGELQLGIEAVDAATARFVARLRGDFALGFADAAQSGVAAFLNLTNVGMEAADRLVTGGLDRLTEGFAAVISGAKSGEQAFKEFAAGMLQELSRVIARLLIVKALSGFSKLFSGGQDLPSDFIGPPTYADGGVHRGRLLATRKFADGGIAHGPTLGLFGEAGAEAFVPLRSGKIPVSITNRGQAEGLHVHFAVEAVDAASVRQLFTAEREHLAGLVQNAINTRKGLRQTVRRATR